MIISDAANPQENYTQCLFPQTDPQMCTNVVIEARWGYFSGPELLIMLDLFFSCLL